MMPIQLNNLISGICLQRSLVPIAMALSFLFLAFGTASASPETFILDPASPVTNEPFYINITTNGSCIAQLTVANFTGHVIWDGLISITGNSTSIGPLLFDEGNYTVNATFWYVLDGNLTLSTLGSEIIVSPPAEEVEKYSALSVMIIGISVVFLVLGILAACTLITGRLLPVEAKPAPASSVVDSEKEKVAAMAALMRFRGD